MKSYFSCDVGIRQNDVFGEAPYKAYVLSKWDNGQWCIFMHSLEITSITNHVYELRKNGEMVLFTDEFERELP